jgi:dcm: DNA (cytosine-5-)-methyltransferase
MRFIDFFSGIGGFRLGMEMAGHECVGHCEIDKFANKSYIAMHSPKESEWYADDIRRVNPGDLPKAEVYCFGFPCQAFSIAGKRRGFEDTRGTLFLKSCGWLKSESLIYYSPKMSRAFSATRGGEHSELSSERWMNWGTMSNGRYVTAKTSECPRTGKECLLSDILEDEVSEKYFLSETAIKRLITYKDKKLEPLQQGRAKGQQSEHMLLKINSMRKLNK